MTADLVYFGHLLKDHVNLRVLNLEVGVHGVSGFSLIVRKIVFLNILGIFSFFM